MIDVLFGNEDEVLHADAAARDLDDALARLRRKVSTLVVDARPDGRARRSRQRRADRDRRGAGRQGRRHDRRRRPVRRRLPRRALPRPPLEALPRSRGASRPPKSSRISARGPKRTSRSWPACEQCRSASRSIAARRRARDPAFADATRATGRRRWSAAASTSSTAAAGSA